MTNTNNSFAYNSIHHTEKNIWRYLSLFLIFIMQIICFSVAANTFSKEVEYQKNFSETNVEEVWLTKLPMENNTLLNFNGDLFVCKNNKKINADFFMSIQNMAYNIDFFPNIASLQPNQCILSKNVANDFNIKIGDKLSVFSTNIEFIVNNFCESLPGFDPKYNHAGVIVASYDKNLITYAHDKEFVYFSNEIVETIEAQISYKNLDIESEKLCKSLIIYSFAIIFFTIVITIFIELFIFRRKLKDYSVDLKEGISKNKYLRNVLIDSFIKYTTSTVIISLCFAKIAHSFLNGYLAFISLILFLSFLSVLITTIIYFNWRKKYGS